MPAPPATPKGAATRRRILDAAAAEFAERGIAGARVDRVIAAARTNKAQLYAYFGSKDGLFDAVMADRLQAASGDTPFDAADLPGWAAALYDANLRHPGLVRLLAWARLERRPAGLVTGDAATAPKTEAVARAQAEGALRPGDPGELLTLVAAMAGAWSPASGVYAVGPDDPEHDHARRRELLRDAVRRAVAP